MPATPTASHSATRPSTQSSSQSSARPSILHFPEIGNYIRAMADNFPPTSEATPPGIVCQGGCLSVQLLLASYSKGIFPWFNEGEPTLWWSPDPRCILLPEDYHLPRRAARAQRRKNFVITLDRAFEKVIRACSLRKKTWLTYDMRRVFCALHDGGFAHSLECWQDGVLVGGLYGMALGRAFFGESMFHTESEASRACLAALVALMRERGMTLLDCQQETAHVMAQGARLVPREEFEERLACALRYDPASRDALTAEYRDVGTGSLWPFLPWGSDHVHINGRWERRKLDLDLGD